MIKMKFKSKSKEVEFFKKIPYLNEVEHVQIRYAEMVNDVDDQKQVLKNFEDE